MLKINKKGIKNDNYKQDAIQHFRLSIIDAKLAYTLFKSLYLSRAENIAGKVMTEKYLWIQKQYGGFFTLVEHCAVTTFIIKILHGFDDDRKGRSLTLKDIDNQAYTNFVSESCNKEVIDKIRNLRHKRVAHYDKTVKINQDLPSFEKIDNFFKRLEEFYDSLTKKIENSSTIREQDQDLKNNLDMVLQDLFIGRKIKLLNIELKYDWQDNIKNISKNKM